MSPQLQLDDLQRTRAVRDPDLPRQVAELVQQPERPPETPIRAGALTFARFLQEIRSRSFRRKSREEQAHWRIETLKALEAANAEVPLSDKLRVHEVLLALWHDDSIFARRCLLSIIATVPLQYGPWRALKRIFKEAETKNDTEVYGALTARFDMACSRNEQGVSGATLAYLVRRGWRYLRRLAQALPAAYPDAAVDVLARYTNETVWQNSWVANHIFFHETKQYSRARFRFHPMPTDLLKHRAFADLWTRSPRPLFALLERAQAEQVYNFAISALKSDFRALLREVEPTWVARLVLVQSATVHDFVVWILSNVPRFEQAAFRTLGLHKVVLKLFDSPSHAARGYAAEYARTHARDLPVSDLVRLADNVVEPVRKLAIDLLLGRHPRNEVGLEAWGQLLRTQFGHPVAAKELREHFSAKELTPAWFKPLLFSTHWETFNFAKKNLLELYPRESLGAGFFRDVLNEAHERNDAVAQRVASFALKELEKLDLNALDVDFLRRLLLHPLTWEPVAMWVMEGRLKAETLGAGFLKVLSYHPDWDSDPWLTALRKSHPVWAQQPVKDHPLQPQILAWLGDPRCFRTTDLTMEWLLTLAKRSEPAYHEFAVETMIRAFAPADFAPTTAVLSTAAPTKVELGGASFLFTGKLATMKRQQAEDKVKAANGVAFAAVSSKLHYLVVGDEGSPLYGQGAKGSKQLKAEEINAAGGNIRIISETAFLQMLSGTKVEHSADAALAGSEKLWEMAVAPGTEDAPLAQFARKYIRYHHPDIGQEKTSKPVDPGMELPPAFLTFARCEPLFTDNRKPLRDFALDLARWEFARWAPPASSLLRLCEAPYGEVCRFVAQALLADDAPEHQRYRIDAAKLSPPEVYSFCESPEEETRNLGMELIRRSPRLQLPEELFRLTESQDRHVRAFVIRTLWLLYHERGITADWKPALPPQTTVGAAARKAAAAAVGQRGPGAPHRPEQLPAGLEQMQLFLRRILFEIPPGRTGSKKEDEPQEGIRVRMKPLPARKAKLAQVEVMRDLAVEDKIFAAAVLPGLREFMESRGLSERAACLVAVTRIVHHHPELREVDK